MSTRASRQLEQNQAQSGKPGRTVTYKGKLLRFTFRNQDSGFAVCKFVPDDGGEPLSIVGHLAQLAEGQGLVVEGRISDHPRFGRQLEVDGFEAVLPTSNEGIEAYLSSHLVKGVGPVTAKKIVAAFGAQTLQIIEEEPERLLAVPGLGEKKATELAAAIRSQKDIQTLVVFLRTHGLSQGLAARIVKRYGRGAAALVLANPYRLADEVFGIGFKTADQIAMSLGMAAEAPERIRAGILFTLAKAARDGHCYVPAPDLERWTAELLLCAPELIAAELPFVATQGRIQIERPPGPRVLTDGEPDIVYPKSLFEAEKGFADLVDTLQRSKQKPLPIHASQALDWFSTRSGMKLPEAQRAAVLTAFEAPCSVITGGPGVGKTTIIRALAEILSQKGLVLRLAAPTGRAAKRLEESTRRSATTIHRLLEFQAGMERFQRNPATPLEGDMLVVDESSMLDIQLAWHLLRAVPSGMRVVFVGDVDQLPAVGPGNVLKDLIASGRVPVTALTEIYRQQEGSEIITAAHDVLRGVLPKGSKADGDFFFVEANSTAHTRLLVRELVVHRIPRRFGLDPIDDIQVLCPMYRGEAGADTLNRDLQDLLNPGQLEIVRGARTYRLGDKVMQTKNNYDDDVFNGDVGRITNLDRGAAVAQLRFGERTVEYPFSDLDQIIPAYAISVHRSQGSEYPAVVMPLTSEHFLMLRRKLLYTGLTRGRRLVVLVGSLKALATAVRNDQEGHRFTHLAERLRDHLR